MKKTIDNKILVGFIGGYILFIFICWLTFKNSESYFTNTQLLLHTHEVIEKAKAAQYYVEKADEDVLTYLSKKDEDEFKDYKQSIDSLNINLNELSKLVINNTATTHLVDSLIKSITIKKSRLQSLVKQSGDKPFFEDDVDVNINRLITAIDSTEHSLLKQQETSINTDRGTFKIAFIFLSGIIFLHFLIVFYFIRSSFIQRLISEETLAKQNTLINTIVNTSNLNIFVKDVEGRYTFVNDKFLLDVNALYNLNHKKEDLIGKNNTEIGLGIIDERVRAEEQKIINEKKEMVDEFENNFNGVVSYFFRTKTPLLDEENNVYAIANVASNITIRKQLENELVEANKNLEKQLLEITASNKALESFTYTVSHDLRAPLRGITGYSEILKEEYGKKLDVEANRLINVICERAKTMSILIDGLLNFSRLGKKELVKTDVDMEAITETIINEIKEHLGERQVQFVTHPLKHAVADKVLIRQVWHNLIDNAVKYSGLNKNAVIEIGCFEKASEHIYFVRDNGVGFNMQYAHKLFLVFQRLHDKTDFDGVGIGLAIVEKIVSKHGGNIWAESKINEGATFYFSLPVV